MKRVSRMLVVLMLFTLLEPALLSIRANAGDLIELVPTANKMIDDAGVYPGGYNNEYLMGGYQKTEGTVYGYTESMLKFDLSSIDSTKIIQSAKLELHIDNAFRAPFERDDMQPHLNLYGSYNDNWEEDNVRVNLSKDVLIIEGYEAESKKTELIDVTSFIHSQINDGAATFVLSGREIPSDLLDTPLKDVESVITVFARSHSSKKPRLLIEYVPITAPVVETGTATQVQVESATISAEVVADGGKPIIERGIEYRQSGAPDYTKAVEEVAETGNYTVELTGLSPSTSYEVRAYATNEIGTSYGDVITFTTKDITATISSDQSLTEENLDGRKITVTLEGITFNTSLDASDFTLQNEPPGLTISEVVRMSDTEVLITLSFDGIDFDSDHTLDLMIAETALANNSSLTTASPLVIVATNDPESISLSTVGEIWEEEEDGKQLNVTLSGGTFSKTITPSNWTVTNLPSGVSKGAVERVDAKTVHITLNGNATTAYAGDITNVSVSLTKDEYEDSTGGGSLSANSGIVLKAKKAPTVSTEGAADVTANSATVAGEVTDDGKLPITERGIEYRKDGAGSYTKVVDPAPGLGSYSAQLTGLEASTTYEYRAYAMNAKGMSYGNVQTFTTKDITATISADQSLTEENLHGRKITVTLDGTTYKTSIDAGDFTLQNAPPRLTIGEVVRTSATEAVVTLSYDGTDFDSDYALGLTIAETALASNSALTATPLLPIIATDDPETITLSQLGEILEGEEDGQKLIVTLTGGTFATTLTPSNWTVANLPSGVSKGAVERVDAKTVHITLNGNATTAYAGDITNVSVSLTKDEYGDSTGGGSLSANSGIVLKAYQAPTVVTGAATDVEATSVSLSGEVTSEGTKLVTEQGIEYRKGGSSDNYMKLEATTTGSGSFTVQATGLEASTTYEYRAYAMNERGMSYGNVQTFTTKDITATISADQGLTEENLHGRKITVTLDGTTYKTSIDAGDFTLQNAPPGLTIGEVVRTSANEAVVTLSYDSTDFDSDYALGLTIAETALASNSALTATPPLPIIATDDPETITLSQLGEIWEGEEDGQKLIVTLTGGTFATTLTPSNWTVANLPSGVSKGAVERVDAKTVHITLNGNATTAYAGDITNVSVSLTKDEYGDSTGGESLSANSGIVLQAYQSPTVSTGTATNVGAKTATLSGEVTAVGSKPVIERGIEYRKIGSSGNYTRLVAQTTGGGVFSVEAMGLEPNTAYEYRAYVKNDKEVIYDVLKQFTTINLSQDANLQEIILSTGSINEAFSPNDLFYTANVANHIREIQITATTADSLATMEIAGQRVASGTPSQLIPLAVGNNEITINVTAQGGAKKTYTILIKRASTSSGGGGGGGGEYQPQPKPKQPTEENELNNREEYSIKWLRVSQKSNLIVPLIGQRQLINQAIRYFQSLQKN